DREAQRHAIVARRRHLGFGEKGEIAQAKPVALVVHSQPATERDRRYARGRRRRRPARRDISLARSLRTDGLLQKCGQLRLIFGVGAGDNQAKLFVINAQVTLSVQSELTVDRGIDQAGKADNPGPALANPRSFFHLVRGTGQLLRNWLGRSLVIVERAL